MGEGTGIPAQIVPAEARRGAQPQAMSHEPSAISRRLPIVVEYMNKTVRSKTMALPI